MLWFKHIANTTSDPDLMTAILRYGSDAYYVFFETLEILTKEEVFDEPKKFDWKFFKTFFPHIRGPKLREILQYFAMEKTSSQHFRDVSPRFSATFHEDSVILFCNKLSELSSSYKKKLGISRQNDSTHRREKKEERRKNKNIGEMQPPGNPAPLSSLESKKPEKKKFGESVFISESELKQLSDKLKDPKKVDRVIEILDNYKTSKGRSYKNDYRAILSWVVDKLEDEIKSGKFKPTPPVNPLKERQDKINLILDNGFAECRLTESEAWAKYNEETNQALKRHTISDIEAKYFVSFLKQYYQKERG